MSDSIWQIFGGWSNTLVTNVTHVVKHDMFTIGQIKLSFKICYVLLEANNTGKCDVSAVPRSERSPQ